MLLGSLALVAADKEWTGPDRCPDTLGTALGVAPDAAPDVAGTGGAPPVLAPAAVLAISSQVQKKYKNIQVTFQLLIYCKFCQHLVTCGN